MKRASLCISCRPASFLDPPWVPSYGEAATGFRGEGLSFRISLLGEEEEEENGRPCGSDKSAHWRGRMKGWRGYGVGSRLDGQGFLVAALQRRGPAAVD